ncbi:hypothetical protein ACQEVS_00550 [Streptomyces sp. CA-181903]|uniref:hypothetical protein n=1 Tax=Streptomyces sp. CA-181903 TaxID=3240055 RepID=UPI003D933D9E
MVFHNVFDFGDRSAGLFSVRTGAKAQPGADVDFEDADDDTYDDKSTSLFDGAIHGASSRAKVVQEQSPEARVILGFLGSFIRTTQESAGAQAQFAKDAHSVSTAAADGMQRSSSTVKGDPDLRKDEDLQMPRKSDYAKAPKTPEAPKAPDAGKAPKATADDPSGSK